MSKSIVLCWVFAAVSIAGCKNEHSNYCEDVPDTHNCMDKIDADMSCTSNAQCSGATPVCDVGGTNMCVQCTTADASACSGLMPVCGSNNMCQACTMHSQCTTSNVCLPDGSCSDGTNVAYVAASGSGIACTKAMPCATVANALATNRTYIKISGTIDEAVTINNDSATILADPGAKLIRTNNGNILVIDGTSVVTIYDLEISGASGTGVGVSMPSGVAQQVTLDRVKLTNNAGGAISALGGTLTVSQSTISGNSGGGISMVGTGITFNITNNFIVRNGNSSTATVGGASLAGTASSVFAFNTVVDNQILNTTLGAGGVLCDIAGFTAPNNIIVRNFVNADETKTNSNTNGQCSYPTSTTATSVAGLMFASPDNLPYNYHIGSTSTAVDQATTASSVAIDFDGDARPQGVAPDRGADEYK